MPISRRLSAPLPAWSNLQARGWNRVSSACCSTVLTLMFPFSGEDRAPSHSRYRSCARHFFLLLSRLARRTRRFAFSTVSVNQLGGAPFKHLDLAWLSRPGYNRLWCMVIIALGRVELGSGYRCCDRARGFLRLGLSRSGALQSSPGTSLARSAAAMEPVAALEKLLWMGK